MGKGTPRTRWQVCELMATPCIREICADVGLRLDEKCDRPSDKELVVQREKRKEFVRKLLIFSQQYGPRLFGRGRNTVCCNIPVSQRGDRRITFILPTKSSFD